MYSNILLIIKLPHHLSEFQLERTESPSSLPAKGKVSHHAHYHCMLYASIM